MPLLPVQEITSNDYPGNPPALGDGPEVVQELLAEGKVFGAVVVQVEVGGEDYSKILHEVSSHISYSAQLLQTLDRLLCRL